MKNILILSVIALIFSSCNNPDNDTLNSSSEIVFNVKNIKNINTRVGYDTPLDITSSDPGFSIYVVDDPASVASSGNRADNHNIKWNGSTWINETTRIFGTKLEWPKNGTVSAFAFCPYRADGTDDVTKINIRIESDQTTLGKLKRSDFLSSQALNCQKSENGTIPLTFYHKLSKLKFNLTWNDPSEILTSLSVSPLFRTGTYNLVTDKITTNLTHQSNPQAYIYNKTSTSATAEVILMPQEVSKGNFVTIVTERNGQKIYYILKLPENLALDGSTLYNFNVSLEFNEESDIIIKPSMLSVEKWEEREEGNWELDAN